MACAEDQRLTLYVFADKAVVHDGAPIVLQDFLKLSDVVILVGAAYPYRVTGKHQLLLDAESRDD